MGVALEPSSSEVSQCVHSEEVTMSEVEAEVVAVMSNFAGKLSKITITSRTCPLSRVLVIALPALTDWMYVEVPDEVSRYTSTVASFNESTLRLMDSKESSLLAILYEQIGLFGVVKSLIAICCELLL